MPFVKRLHLNCYERKIFLPCRDDPPKRENMFNVKNHTVVRGMLISKIEHLSLRSVKSGQ